MKSAKKVMADILARVPEASTVVDIPTAPETEAPDDDCGCAHCRHSYTLGVRQALEEMKSRPIVGAPAAPARAPITIDETMANFEKWIGAHGGSDSYYGWEPETREALRAALVEGDIVEPRFAYSCVIAHSDGTRTEFVRRPNRKK
jgi:hypothetical protein